MSTVSVPQGAGRVPAGSRPGDPIRGSNYGSSSSGSGGSSGGSSGGGGSGPSGYVADIQRALKRAGFSPGPVDNKWGPRTAGALRSYQRSKGLQVDGVLGPQSARSLGVSYRGLLGSSGSSGGSSSSGSSGGSSGGSGGGGGSSSGGSGELLNMPGGGELWKAGGRWFVVYDVPDHDGRMAWRVPKGDLDSLTEGKPKAAKTLSSPKAMRKSGVTTMGTSDRIQNTSEHPFRTFMQDLKDEAEVKPWLRDEEVLTVHLRAIMEGRDVREAELQGTKWFQTRTEGERQWAALTASDPETAQQRLRDNRLTVKNMMERQFGASPSAANQAYREIADRWTRGEVGDEQMERLAWRAVDPWAPGSELDRSQGLTGLAGENEVREELHRWLGPLMAQEYDDNWIAEWAGRMRRSPEGTREALTQRLQKQRLAMLPEWDDPTLTYEDIAPAARTAFQSVWEQQPDETDPFFMDVLRNTRGDMAQAQTLLRKRGLEKGNQAVTRDALLGVGQASGGGVRQVV